MFRLVTRSRPVGRPNKGLGRQEDYHSRGAMHYGTELRAAQLNRRKRTLAASNRQLENPKP